MTARREGQASTCVEVVVRAMIGHGERVLLIRRREDDHWFLPGGQLEPGEPAEVALRRKIASTLNTEIKSASFLAVVEHGYADRHRNDHHEVNLIFDVTISTSEVACTDGLHDVQWLAWEGLSAIDFRPVGLGASLQSGRFDQGDRWLPWRPSAIQ